MTMVESPACEEEADAVIGLWPECEAAIENGTLKCTESTARRVFKVAVSEVCRPFGEQDYQLL
jgi:hypothetical protein